MVPRLVLALALVGCSSGATPPADPSGRLNTPICEPSGWNTRSALADELLQDVLDGQEWPDMTLRESQVLAWSVYRDDRPVVVHNALVWVQAYDEYGTEGWYVLLLARNPGEDWGLASTDHEHLVGQMFDALPTAAEIDAFLAESRWQWELEEGWRFEAANVCAQTWSDVAGSAPVHAFPPGAPSTL